MPECVYLDVMWTCNLRCIQCDIHRLKNPDDEISLDARAAIIREVGGWNPAPRLVLSGGEPFTRREAIYALARTAREHGLPVTISTNGTLLRPDDAARLPTSGITTVVVSLDSHVEEIHDRIRGVPGTFEKAVRSIRWLVEARDHAGNRSGRERFSVMTMSILGSNNLADLDSLVAFAERLGIDHVLFQPIQPVFARPVTESWWEVAPLFPRSRAEVDRGIDALIDRRKTDPRLLQDERQLEAIREFLKAPGRQRPGRCVSMDRNVMIDMRGDVRLCFGMVRRGIDPIGNVRQRPVREMWGDAQTENCRQLLRRCQEPCALMMAHSS